MLGSQLRKIRKRKGITQQKLSMATGVSQSTISQIESGSRKSPSIQLVGRLADKLGIKVDDLL